MTNEKLIDFIAQQMRDNKVDFNSRFDGMDKRFLDLSEEVKELSNFKWKMIGAATGSSIVISVIFQFIAMILKKGQA